MPNRWLVCQRCGAEFALGAYFFGCPACVGNSGPAPLEVRYDLRAAKRTLLSSLADGNRTDLWRFSPLLPVENPSLAVSLGEGCTPFVSIPRLNEAIGTSGLLVKNESQNPTWSFKDRFNTVTISMARQLGIGKVASSSTGNQGASAAAYAAAAGMRCVVLVPDETPDLLRRLIEAYGAKTIVTRWNSRGALLTSLVSEDGWFPASTLAPMPAGSPYGIEGYKTIAFEMILASQDTPIEFVFVPVGGGDGLYGLYKGWKEFIELGLAEIMPKFVGVQPAGANPVVRALREGKSIVSPVADAWSIATSTREEMAADYAIAAIKSSEGFALDVSEDEILDALLLLSRHGMAVEAASALPIAGLRKALRDEHITPHARVAAVLTSSLIKWPMLLSDLTPGATYVTSMQGLRDAIDSVN
jgi:threonine synthase